MPVGLSPKEQRVVQTVLHRVQQIERMQQQNARAALLPIMQPLSAKTNITKTEPEERKPERSVNSEMEFAEKLSALRAREAIVRENYQQKHAEYQALNSQAVASQSSSYARKEARENLERTRWDLFEDLLNNTGESFTLFGGIYITDGIIKVLRTIKTFMPSLGGDFFLWEMIPIYAIAKGRWDEYRHLLVGSAIIVSGLLTFVFLLFIATIVAFVFSRPLEAAPYLSSFGIGFIQSLLFGGN